MYIVTKKIQVYERCTPIIHEDKLWSKEDFALCRSQFSSCDNKNICIFLWLGECPYSPKHLVWWFPLPLEHSVDVWFCWQLFEDSWFWELELQCWTSNFLAKLHPGTCSKLWHSSTTDTTGKYGIFFNDFLFLGTEEYNCDIFFGIGTKEYIPNRRIYRHTFVG
jgi:hypothetical protein